MSTRTMRMRRMIPTIMPAPNPLSDAGGFTLTWPMRTSLRLIRRAYTQAPCRPFGPYARPTCDVDLSGTAGLRSSSALSVSARLRTRSRVWRYRSSCSTLHTASPRRRRCASSNRSPYILFGAPAGALIDRANKRLLLIACDSASVLLTLVIPVSAAAGVFSVELVYVIGFLLGTVEVMWGVTTDFSVVPSLVEQHE